MPRHHSPQSANEIFQALARFESYQNRLKISIPLSAHEMMEEYAFLQRGERIDVLNVGRSSRHSFDNPVDLLLRQLHERQHLGPDRIASRRYEVGRRFKLPLASAIDRLGQRSQRT